MSSNNVVDLRRKRTGASAYSGPRLPLPPARKPREPLRMRRRRGRVIALVVLLVLIAATAVGISWASYLPQFNVTSVTVSGASTVSASDVQAFVEQNLSHMPHGFISPTNIFVFKTAPISRTIVDQFPRIKSAAVTRASLLATILDVNVSERQPYALWCRDESKTECYQTDESGYIFAIEAGASSTPLATHYVFYGGIASSTPNPIGQSFAPGHVPGIVVLLDQLAQQSLSPQSASVSNDQDFSVQLGVGYYLKASFGQSPEMLVNNLNLVLSSDALAGKTDQLEYIDLRFGDKVYYKLKGQRETGPN